MISRDIVATLTEARRRVPRDVWNQLAARLAKSESIPDSDSIRLATAGLLNRDAASIMSAGLANSSGVKWSEIVAAMITVDCLVGDTASSMEIIWTGPANNRFPVRRIDQVLYDLIAKATKRVILVTFAAHRVHHLCTHLTQAVQRGVELTLIVESEAESEGQLSLDAMVAFRDLPLAHTRIYFWPLERRERNQSGRPGKLHVKCAIVDDVVLIGSANLTDDAFNRNMEMGVLVNDESFVHSIAQHFVELINFDVLQELPRRNALG